MQKCMNLTKVRLKLYLQCKFRKKTRDLQYRFILCILNISSYKFAPIKEKVLTLFKTHLRSGGTHKNLQFLYISICTI